MFFKKNKITLTNDWTTYSTTIDDNEAIIHLDLAAYNEVNLQYNHTYVIILKNITAEDNLVSRLIIEINNKLLKSKLAIYHISTYFISANRECYLVYVSNQEIELNQLLNRIAPEIKSEVVFLRDDNWNYYFTILYPNPYEHNRIINKQIIEQLTAQKESFKESRPIDYYVSFQTEASALAFIKDLPQEFSVDYASLKNTDNLITLHFSNSTIPQLENMNEITSELVTLAIVHEASFDGWGTKIHK
ncbi:DUF695 domain-containing protein [Erysipelotrichaceae bacterium OttesenSCG-928-M19]|nr:DUF695 domain-containing protein [Erysipelotrichaceae bacterium OttesenSCG-928-M19]